MEMLSVILAVSIIMWYIIDRLKHLWEKLSFANYVTMAVAAVFAFALAFGYHLDIMMALKVVSESSTMGTVMTALLLMGGSSAVSEIVSKIKA